MCSSLRRLGIVSDKNVDSLIENELLCPQPTELCRFRNCKKCEDNMVKIFEFDGESECTYEMWTSEKEVGSDGKQHWHLKKAKISCTIFDLVSEFTDDILPKYLVHRGVDRHQKETMNLLKEALGENDALVICDFSENFSYKYAEEVQSFHFGGSRIQKPVHVFHYYWSNRSTVP